MDKSYVDLEVLYRMTDDLTYFVFRENVPIKYEVVDINYNINELVGIVGDKTIRFTGHVSMKSIRKTCASLSAYLLLVWVKVTLKSPLTITEGSKVVGASLITKTNLRELLNVPATHTQNQNVNELELNF